MAKALNAEGVRKMVHKWFEKWRTEDFYNLPITENFKHTSPFGTIDGKEAYLKLVEDNKLLDSTVEEIMEECFPILDAKTEIDEVKKVMKENNAILVSDFGRIVDLITRYDLIEFDES